MDFPKKIKKIVLDPDPRLRAPNADVTEPWVYLEPWVRKMFKVMYAQGNGVGISAPQVGWNVRLFCMNPDDKSKKPKAERVYWNPTILEAMGGQVKVSEGCLSLPKVFGKVVRYRKVRMQAMTPAGPVVEAFEDFQAQIVQHEVSHLNGVCVWDRFVVDEPAADDQRASQ